MPETLTTEVEFASTSDTNGVTVDVPQPHVEWDVPDGREVVIRGGQPVVMDTETTAGNGGPSEESSDPSRSTTYALAWREPGDPLDQWRTFTEELRQQPFNSLSLSEQQSGDNADRRRLMLDEEVAEVERNQIVFEDVDEIALLALSDDNLEGGQVYFSLPAEIREA